MSDRIDYLDEIVLLKVQNDNDFYENLIDFYDNQLGHKFSSKEALLVYLINFFNNCKKDMKNSDYIFRELKNKIEKYIYNKIMSERYEDILEYFNKLLIPTNYSQKGTGEVFTNLKLVNEMLDKLPQTVWSNPNLKWLDPANGIGNYPIVIFTRLMEGLENIIKDKEKRRKHILENMIYVAELSKKNCMLYNIILSHNGKYKLNIFCGNSLELDIKKEWDIDFFDIIIGNPPYNKTFDKNTKGASPLYNIFIDKYINLSTYISFVIPAKWFSGGKGLNNFRSMMINRTDIELISYEKDEKKWFKNIDLKGGIMFFLINKNYNDLCNFNGKFIKLNKYDILFPYVKYYDLIDKLNNFPKLIDLYHGQGFYKIKTNDNNLNNNTKLIKCYVSKQKGFIKYIDKKYIKENYNMWKVITTRVAHKGNSGFGNIFIGTPDEVCNQSYIFFKVTDENQAKSLESYLKCKLTNLLLSFRKFTQDIQEHSLKWIPLPPLDRLWTDSKIFEYYDLESHIIKLIEKESIVGFK